MAIVAGISVPGKNINRKNKQNYRGERLQNFGNTYVAGTAKINAIDATYTINN